MTKRQFKEFALATAERAVKTFAQSEVALLTAAGTGLLDTDFAATLSISGMAALLSLLTSIGSGFVAGPGPSVVGAEELPHKGL